MSDPETDVYAERLARAEAFVRDELRLFGYNLPCLAGGRLDAENATFVRNIATKVMAISSRCIKPLRCPECGQYVRGHRGYTSHWAQAHWKLQKQRPEPEVAKGKAIGDQP